MFDRILKSRKRTYGALACFVLCLAGLRGFYEIKESYDYNLKRQGVEFAIQSSKPLRERDRKVNLMGFKYRAVVGFIDAYDNIFRAGMQYAQQLSPEELQQAVDYEKKYKLPFDTYKIFISSWKKFKLEDKMDFEGKILENFEDFENGEE